MLDGRGRCGDRRGETFETLNLAVSELLGV